MNCQRITQAALAAIMLLGGAGPSLAQGEKPDLSIELNTTKPLKDACQLMMVVDNRSSIRFNKFTVELVLFDKTGVIIKQVLAAIGRLRPMMNHFVSFPIEDVNCYDLGRVLLNEVTECEYAAEAKFDCTEVVAVKHRGTVPLFK